MGHKQIQGNCWRKNVKHAKKRKQKRSNRKYLGSARKTARNEPFSIVRIRPWRPNAIEVVHREGKQGTTPPTRHPHKEATVVAVVAAAAAITAAAAAITAAAAAITAAAAINSRCCNYCFRPLAASCCYCCFGGFGCCCYCFCRWRHHCSYCLRPSNSHEPIDRVDTPTLQPVYRIVLTTTLQDARHRSALCVTGVVTLCATHRTPQPSPFARN